jgi:hypothetical protein
LQKVEQGDLAGIGTDSVGLSLDEARLPRAARIMLRVYGRPTSELTTSALRGK